MARRRVAGRIWGLLASPAAPLEEAVPIVDGICAALVRSSVSVGGKTFLPLA